jgi:uncharacterized membrane protein
MNKHRYLIGGLIASLALNLVLVGVLAGRATTQELGIRRIDPVIGLRQLLSDLPEERIDTLRPYYRDYLRSLRPRFRDIRHAQQDLREAILSNPLDTEALHSALQAFNTQFFNTQTNAHEPLVALVAALRLEERQQLVAHLSDHRRRGDRPRAAAERNGHPHWPPPGPRRGSRASQGSPAETADQQPPQPTGDSPQ